jgi:hypothetical protein
MRWITVPFGLGVAALFGCAAIPADNQAGHFRTSVAINGADELVIPASQFGRCVASRNGITFPDVPDAPPRMFRRPDGTLLMTAPDSGNVPFESRDGMHFTRSSCASVLPSKLDPNPAKYADQDWIAGFYTANGQDVFALVHDEYHGVENIPACKARLAASPGNAYVICQQIALTGYISHNAGQSFTPLPFDQPLAAPPVKLTPDNVSTFSHTGVHDPSNIVRNPADGYYYFLALAAGGAQIPGTCAFRSKDPLTEPWFAWNGSSFATRMGSPYSGAGEPCIPVRVGQLYTPAITYNTVLGEFIAIGQSTDKNLVAQISPDLVHWGDVIVLRPNVKGSDYSAVRGDSDPTQYFSIIDPESTSRYFDTSGDHPYLYYVKIPVQAGRVQWRAREIWRVSLAVRNTEAKAN